MKRFIPSLLSVALACASLESMAAADLIITNAKVFTGEPGQALQQAVAVEDGKILQVGSNVSAPQTPSSNDPQASQCCAPISFWSQPP